MNNNNIIKLSTYEKISKFEVPPDPQQLEEIVLFTISQKLVNLLLQEDFIDITVTHEDDGVAIVGSLKVVQE